MDSDITQFSYLNVPYRHVRVRGQDKISVMRLFHLPWDIDVNVDDLFNISLHKFYRL